MPYVISCEFCGSRVELARYGKSCPICGEVVCPEGLGERRSDIGVPFIRNWITALRLSGGDFDKRAARLTHELAHVKVRHL